MSDLSEERASDEPEAVVDAELVLHHVVVHHTGVRVVPLIGGEPRHDKQGETHQDVGGQHIQPDLHSQRVHEANDIKCEITKIFLLVF